MPPKPYQPTGRPRGRPFGSKSAIPPLSQTSSDTIYPGSNPDADPQGKSEEPQGRTDLYALSTPEQRPTKPGQQLTWARQEAFLIAFRRMGTIQGAAVSVGLHSQTPSEWLRADTLGFRQRFNDLGIEGFKEHIVELMMERVHEPQGNRGSDVLLMALGNAFIPEKFKPANAPADTTAQEVLAELRNLARERRDREREEHEETKRLAAGGAPKEQEDSDAPKR